MALHRLEVAPDTAVDVYDPAHTPALEIDPGDRIVVTSLDASGHVERQLVPGEQRPKLFAEARGHCLTGPISVRGARPGAMLALRLERMTPGEWGWTVSGGRDTPVMRRLGITDETSWLLWDIDATTGVATESRGLTCPVAPFLGVMGVAPREPGEHSTVPPRAASGGNIDCRELVACSTLYLPVNVPGALLYLGDGHAAQGDGEVGGTAIECPMTTQLVVDVVDERPLASVHAETPAGLVTFGFDPSLDVASGDALAAMTTWLQVLHGIDRSTALALASACVDLRVTQIANGSWGVHAVLRPTALGAPPHR